MAKHRRRRRRRKRVGSLSELGLGAPIGAGSESRTALFISHANPEDNAFTVWLGAKLAALGYEVWADVLRLRGGHDWQRLLEEAIRHRALKFLLVGTQASVTKQGVRNEVQIAHDVGKRIGDNEFIIPLRLQRFDTPFLIAHAQYVDFLVNWSAGLADLLETLEGYHVPRSETVGARLWMDLQTLHARPLSTSRERLMSNWVPISGLPPRLRYLEFRRNASAEEMTFRLKTCPRPAIPFQDGCLSFASADELMKHFGAATLRRVAEIPTKRFVDQGWRRLEIDRRGALSFFSDLGRQGLEHFFHARQLNGYELASERFAWWAPLDAAPTGKVAFQWGDVAGLRQIQGVSAKRRMHWHFGVTAYPRIRPVPHVRFTSRVVFTVDGLKPFDDRDRMHRLRRSFSKGWRNPRWRDMLLAFLFWLAQGSDELAIPMSADSWIIARLPPLRFRAPVGISHEPDLFQDDADEGTLDDGDTLDSEDEFDDEEED